jgi:hypothetical protein
MSESVDTEFQLWKEERAKKEQLKQQRLANLRRGNEARAARSTAAVPSSNTVTAEETELKRAESRASSAAKVIVDRLDPSTGVAGYVGTLSPDLATPETLARECGGGQYRLRYYDSDGVFQFDDAINVDLSIPKRSPSWYAEPAAVGVATPAGSSPMDAALLSIVQQQSNMTLAFVEKMSRPGPDAAAWIAALSPIVIKVVESFGSKKDPIELARQIAELKAPAAASQPLTEVLAVARELSEMRRGGGRPRSVVDRVLDAAPALLDKFAQMQQAKPPAPAAAPSGQPALPTPTNPPVADTDPMAPLIRSVVQNVLPLAQQGRDPRIHAQAIVDMAALQPDTLKQLEEFAKDPKAVVRTCSVSPEMIPHQKWAAEFLDGVVDEIDYRRNPPAEEDDDEGEEEGDDNAQ